MPEGSDELRVCFVTKGVKRKLQPGNWNSVTMGSAAKSLFMLITLWEGKPGANEANKQSFPWS